MHFPKTLHKGLVHQYKNIRNTNVSDIQKYENIHTEKKLSYIICTNNMKCDNIHSYILCTKQ